MVTSPDELKKQTNNQTKKQTIILLNGYIKNSTVLEKYMYNEMITI